MIAVARNDPEGFRAVNKLLDSLKEAYSVVVTGSEAQSK